MSNLITYDDKFNIILVGDEKVGKTSIIERFIKNKFYAERHKTHCVEKYTKDKIINNKKILLKIWDTVGQENATLMTKNHYKMAHAIILVFALNNLNSFNNLNNWIEGIKEKCEVNVKLVLMGNKCDLSEKREVSHEKLKEFADKTGIDFIEASAKTNVNIEEVFNKISNDIYNSNYGKGKGFELEEGSYSSGSKKMCC